MVKNRAPKQAARALKAKERIPYPRALARVSLAVNPELQLTLGSRPDGSSVTWSGHRFQLAIQGGAGTGKTALLNRLVEEGARQVDVYYYSTQTTPPQGLAGSADTPDSAADMLREIVGTMDSTISTAKEHLLSQLTPAQKKNSFSRNPGGSIEDLPADHRPWRKLVFLDDFDVLYRNWESSQRGLRGQNIMRAPSQVMSRLRSDGRRAGIGAVVAGQSITRHLSYEMPYTDRLILGPASLAERESFLHTDLSGLNPGQGWGLYAPAISDDATEVRLFS